MISSEKLPKELMSLETSGADIHRYLVMVETRQQLIVELLRIGNKSDEFDIKLAAYLIKTITSILSIIPEDSDPKYPVLFEGKTFSTREEIENEIISIAVAERQLIKKRGEGRSDQIGDHFWKSKADDFLGEYDAIHNKVLSLVVKVFSVDTEKLFQAIRSVK